MTKRFKYKYRKSIIWLFLGVTLFFTALDFYAKLNLYRYFDFVTRRSKSNNFGSFFTTLLFSVVNVVIFSKMFAFENLTTHYAFCSLFLFSSPTQYLRDNIQLLKDFEAHFL